MGIGQSPEKTNRFAERTVLKERTYGVGGRGAGRAPGGDDLPRGAGQ